MVILLWPKKGGSHGGPGLCLSGTEDANSPFWSPVHASVGPGQRWHFGAAVRIQVCPQEAARALYCMFGGLVKAICTIITIFLQPASGVPQAPAAVALEHPVVMGCSLPSAYRLSLSTLKSWQLSLISKPGLRKGQLSPLSHSREKQSQLSSSPDLPALDSGTQETLPAP